jgi:hypothetical protein
MAESDAFRHARTESHSRDVNEQIQDVAQGFGKREGESELDFILVCECSDPGCNDPISVTEAEYEAVRAEPTHFAIVDGHELDEIEQVVFRSANYVVVEKTGEAGAVARGYDRRAKRE